MTIKKIFYTIFIEMSLINLKKVKIAMGDEEPKRKTEKQIFDVGAKPKTKNKKPKPKNVKNFGKPEEDLSLKNFLKLSKQTSG